MLHIITGGGGIKTLFLEGITFLTTLMQNAYLSYPHQTVLRFEVYNVGLQAKCQLKLKWCENHLKHHILFHVTNSHISTIQCYARMWFCEIITLSHKCGKMFNYNFRNCSELYVENVLQWLNAFTAALMCQTMCNVWEDGINNIGVSAYLRGCALRMTSKVIQDYVLCKLSLKHCSFWFNH